MKKKVFWIIYYAVAITVLSVTLVLFGDYITFTWYSAFPIAYITIAVIVVVLMFFDSHRSPDDLVEDMKRARIISKLPLDYPPLPSAENVARESRISDHMTAKAFCVCMPPILFFVFWGSNMAKILSVLFLVVSYFATILMMVSRVSAEAKKKSSMIQQERKKQEQKEELGKWK